MGKFDTEGMVAEREVAALEKRFGRMLVASAVVVVAIVAGPPLWRRLLRVLGACLAGLVLLGCASAPPKAEVAEAIPGIIRLLGRFSDGHACPVTPTLAMSCAHMMDLRPFDTGVQLYPSRFDGAGSEGNVRPVGWTSGAADVALYRGEFAMHYELAAGPPAIGEHVRFQGYDWSNRKHAFAPVKFDAKVLRVIAGHVVLDEGGEPGSSGSCVLNDRDEVVGINCFTARMDSTEKVAIVVGVWGAWGADMIKAATVE